MTATRSDVIVFFGSTGDLAYKKIFPALQAMARRGHLEIPVIGVARSGWDLAQFTARVKASLDAHGTPDEGSRTKLASLLRYVDGDYVENSTYIKLRALGNATSPLYYLAIPPSMFAAVAIHLAESGCAKNARIVVEKPFGRDLASSQALNKTLLAHFPESSIFRIDHYLGKEPVQNLVYFRFANPMVEVGWSRESIDSVQITMAESFGVGGRGKFYEEAGATRDVIQNHMLQVVACMAMECPASNADEALRDERIRLLKNVRTLDAANIIRGQFRGYRKEAGVNPGSQVETFTAARFQIDNPRWSGVPFYVRAGKCLTVTATEVLVHFKCPPRVVLSDCSPRLANYYRFRISPEVVIAIGARVKKSGDQLVGENIELLADHESKDEMVPYERLLGAAVDGDSSLFTRQDAVEESWRIVDLILKDQTPPLEYDVGSWGPVSRYQTLAPEGGWHDPVSEAMAPPL